MTSNSNKTQNLFAKENNFIRLEQNVFQMSIWRQLISSLYKTNHDLIQKSLATMGEHNRNNKKTLTLFFSTDEFNEDEIVHMTVFIANVYNEISGDQLLIKRLDLLPEATILESINP